MAKGKFNGMGGGNMMRQQMAMQQKIKKMQQDLEAAQKQVEETLFPVSVGGGAVKAVVNGKKELVELVLSPDVLNPDEADVVQDMVISAVNEALRQAEDAMNKSVEGLSGGLNLGAFGL